MPVPTGAWRFGTYAQREKGGYPGIILWDMVLPWTTPPADAPVWWETPPDLPETQGWERNMQEVGDPLPNFPAELGIKIVMVAVRGLRNSPTSPARRHRTSGDPQDAEAAAWPNTMDDGVQKFFEDLYMPRYIDAGDVDDPGTLIIPWCSERDLRQWFEPSLLWDANDGLAAIVNMVNWFLDNYAYKLAGWGMVDEPELGGRGRLRYASPGSMISLRNVIRETERAWRIVNEAGFDELTEYEQDQRLLPCILNFSRRIVFDELGTTPTGPEGASPENYRGAADIFMYDEYPYRQSIEQLMMSGLTPQEISDSNRAYRLHEPIQDSLDGYRRLWKRLNQTASGVRTISDPLYRPVAAFAQAQGYPAHPRTQTVGTWDTSPAKEPTEDGKRAVITDPDDFSKTITVVSYGFNNALPEIDELRFFVWATLLMLGEGVPCFSLLGISSKNLQERFAPVLHEISYFAALRYSLHNRAMDLASRTYGSTDDDASGRGSGLIKTTAIVFEYPEPPGAAGPETYLLLINPRDAEKDPLPPRTVTLSFDPPLQTVDGVAQQFVPWKFGAEDTTVYSPLQVDPPGAFNVTGTPITFTLNPHTFALYKLMPIPTPP
ncbi:MAG: hypothetical protein ABI743_06600 [bacterium]